jgi:Protein of unknown function (DUF3187)
MMFRTVLGRRCGGLLFWSLLSIGLLSTAEAAEVNGPIAIRNQFPPALFLLIPTPEVARVLERGRFEFESNVSYSGVFNKEVEGTSVLFMDFEALRWTLKARWGIWDRLDADLEIPFLRFSSGFLGSVIQAYHDAFGLPQGGRDQVPNNEFHYEASVGGKPKPLYPIPKPGRFAISDVVLNARYRIFQEDGDRPGMVLKASIKLPTGNNAGGFGSGHLDYGGFLLIERNWSRFTGYGNMGVVIPGPVAGADPSLETQPFAIGVVSGEYRFTDWFSMVLQLDANTRPYASAPFRLLRRHALEIGGGFRFKAGDHGVLEIGFVDGFGSVPDFTASLGMKWRL